MLRTCTLLVVILTLLSSCSKPTKTSDLEKNFINPPTSAKPRTWMHAMDGNMSKEGLTKDLESIAEVGIGGVLLFNVSYSIPSGNILYNSDEHIEMLKHAAKESERLGLDFGVHNCDGWSASGVPWITPGKSMKMIVYNHIVADGGAKVEVQLPQPSIRKNDYKDIAVLA